MITSRRTIEPAAVATHYDELDHFYREVWGDHVHHGLWETGAETRAEAVEQLAALVAARAEVAAGTRVCDIGCGYGATARFLAARGARVTAMTISPAQHAVAKRELGGESNPEFLLGDWLENDLPAESFDAAIAIESSEHMQELARFFAQASRVLRRDGRLVICAWLSADDPGAAAQRWLLEPICREGRMPQMGTVQDYQSLGEGAGFRLARFEDVTGKVARTWPAIVRRLAAKMATRPRYVRFLFSPHAQNRVFALTILRIWLAYRTGAMRYGVFTFEKL